MYKLLPTIISSCFSNSCAVVNYSLSKILVQDIHHSVRNIVSEIMIKKLSRLADKIILVKIRSHTNEVWHCQKITDQGLNSVDRLILSDRFYGLRRSKIYFVQYIILFL